MRQTRITTAIAVLLLMATAAGPVAAADRPAGQASSAAAGPTTRGALWHVLTYIHCNEPTCSGTGVLPPWMETLRNPFNAVSGIHGRFYHRATIIAIGRPGYPRRCDATLFSRPFSGRCVVHDFGRGIIKLTDNGSIPGKPDFWVSSETASFNGGPWMVDPFGPYPLDTGQIASPGHYTKKDLLGSSPRHVQVYMDVTRQDR